MARDGGPRPGQVPGEPPDADAQEGEPGRERSATLAYGRPERTRPQRTVIRDVNRLLGPTALPERRSQDEEGEIMNDRVGHCPLCGGDKQPGPTTFAADLRFGVVVVRQVPAPVCNQCGEAWIEDPVARRLEERVSDARAKRSVVDVTFGELEAA